MAYFFTVHSCDHQLPLLRFQRTLRFVRNRDRVKNRAALIAIMEVARVGYERLFTPCLLCIYAWVCVSVFVRVPAVHVCECELLSLSRLWCG